MGWSRHAKAELAEGREVTIRPRGRSMEPLIRDGQQVTLRPVEAESVSKGDIVLATVKGRDYLHLVKATTEKRVLIGNNRGHLNGWTTRNQVHGKLT